MQFHPADIYFHCTFITYLYFLAFVDKIRFSKAWNEYPVKSHSCNGIYNFQKIAQKLRSIYFKCNTGDRNAISVSISHSFSVASFPARMLIALITWGRLHSLSRNYNEFRENSYEYLRIVYLWTEFRSSANARINYSPVLPFYFCPPLSVPLSLSLTICVPRARSLKFYSLLVV